MRSIWLATSLWFQGKTSETRKKRTNDWLVCYSNTVSCEVEEDAILGGLQTSAFDLSSSETYSVIKEYDSWVKSGNAKRSSHTHTRRRNEDNQDWMLHLSTDATGEPTRFRWIEEKGGRCSNRIAATVQADSKFQLAGVPPGAATVHHTILFPPAFSVSLKKLTTTDVLLVTCINQQDSPFQKKKKENSTWLGPHQRASGWQWQHTDVRCFPLETLAHFSTQRYAIEVQRATETKALFNMPASWVWLGWGVVGGGRGEWRSPPSLQTPPTGWMFSTRSRGTTRTGNTARPLLCLSPSFLLHPPTRIRWFISSI